MTTPVSFSFHFANSHREVHFRCDDYKCDSFSEKPYEQGELDIKEGQTTIHINRSELYDAVLELKTAKYAKFVGTYLGEYFGKILTEWALSDYRWKSDKPRDFKFLQGLGEVQVNSQTIKEKGEEKVFEGFTATKLRDLESIALDVAEFFESIFYGEKAKEQNFSLSGGPPKLTPEAKSAIQEDATKEKSPPPEDERI